MGALVYLYYNTHLEVDRLATLQRKTELDSHLTTDKLVRIWKGNRSGGSTAHFITRWLFPIIERVEQGRLSALD